MRNIVKWTFYIFVTTVTVVGVFSYLADNAKSLIEMSLGIETTQEVEEVYQEEISENYEELVIETIMEFPKAPLEFLDEVLPELTPDPDREWGDVVEVDLSKGTAVGNFYVNDTSETNLDLAEVSAYDLPFTITDYSQPVVLIYHTHTTESYLSGFTGYYYTDETFKNSDPDRSVVMVGEALQEALAEYGIIAIHDTTIHDSPVYSGSYTRSLETIEENLEKYPSIQITIDVHRDSFTASDGTKYKPTVTIDGQDAAQIMIITGADPTGELDFDNWEDNLIFATKIQSVASEMYPGLMRPLMFCQRKYNMDVTTGSLLFEIGNEVNTFAEAKYSATLIADVLYAVLME
ncbi:MAG: stage II sporulation protein P [Clostridia bacterium]